MRDRCAEGTCSCGTPKPRPRKEHPEPMIRTERVSGSGKESPSRPLTAVIEMRSKYLAQIERLKDMEDVGAAVTSQARVTLEMVVRDLDALLYEADG